MLEHAVVIGGGIAGLLAARVLADHAGQVTLLDRDRFVDEPEPRKGVPQGRHLHVFLLGGYQAASRLLPGLAPALDRAGAVPVDWARDMKLRSGEHTSELQSPCNLVCRLLLEKKKQRSMHIY